MTKETVTNYLKWGDTVIGTVYNHNSIKFVNPDLNSIVSVITKGSEEWGEREYTDFLKDRVISKNRRDIEKILFRAGLIEYDAVKIAEITYAFNPKDLFWLSPNEDLRFKDALKGTFENIFRESLDESGRTIQSPDGQNIKNYGVCNHKYGIFKKRLNNLMTDAESEVIVYEISKLLKADVCPAWFFTDDIIFSQFMYDFTKDYLVHVRNYFKDGERTGNLYSDLIKKFPAFEKDIAKMCVLDLVTRQDDRHLSNFAILNAPNGMSFYPLYDNGRSLFYDANENDVKVALKDIITGCTTFGEIGSYYDVVLDISKTHRISELVNLSINEQDIKTVLEKGKLTGYRFEGCLKWISSTIDLLKTL